jgi:hypothetical protein
MKINNIKTEAMKINKMQKPLNLYTDNIQVKQVSEFKYLGSIFAENRRLDREIET